MTAKYWFLLGLFVGAQIVVSIWVTVEWLRARKDAKKPGVTLPHFSPRSSDRPERTLPYNPPGSTPAQTQRIKR